MDSPSIKEQRIRKITHVYYSRPEIQKAILEFSTNREICPRYFEGFGKRPDSLQYASDIFELVKRGATSFHCSEEIWSNPLLIKTGMSEKELNNLRTGWDLLLDIDSPYFDYSKIMAEEIINFLKNSNLQNVGVKFSGSKGFHLIIPWKAFPEEINGVKTSEMFPEWPRIIVKYILIHIRNKVTEKIQQLEYAQLYPNVSKYIKREAGNIHIEESNRVEVFTRGGNSIINRKAISEKMENLRNDEKSSTTHVIPDLVLVAPRHLFRMPYSLHEKTALASVVIDKNKISNFDMKDADPLKIQIKNFIPECKKGEASQLLMQALDWNRENNLEPEKKNIEYKPIQINDRSEKNFPPCIKRILEGVADGKKRSVFALINFFRSIGVEKDELEKILFSWNEKNKPPLQNGYIKLQIAWALKRKPLLPPNCREFYQGIGVCFPDELCSKIKNPVNYVVRKNFQYNKKSPKNKDNFKNNN